ncbi:MAG TPA: YgiQ family radical SAM protein [Syntrophorhabdaceae bacterium]|jgi:uncharacterized radical SAM protein YgiQ
MNNFLPLTKKDMDARGWESLDIIIVTGDAYVDHPSFGAAIIGRVLESAGFRVGIIAQPDWKKTDDFLALGKPRLFFGVTSGNLDSMVANYTSHKKIRSKDAYSPGGKAGLRPDRAVIVYANRIKEAFPGSPLVLGGIEASLRRVAHYDWWDNKVRRSLLLDAKADILVYGMAESQIVEIARRLAAEQDLYGIRGTVIVRKEVHPGEDYLELPAMDEVSHDKRRFNDAFRIFYTNQNPFSGKTLVQRHDKRYVIHFPPALPLGREELDGVYRLPYARSPHPSYKEKGGIPGFETVRFSIISHRGCCGACSFCSLSVHQGKIIQSRSPGSILEEAMALSRNEEFKGTITDIGGPTANLYGARCSRWARDGGCGKKECLVPTKCAMLKLGYRESIDLYKSVMAIPGVKHLFIESGIRYDLLCDDDSAEYFEHLCRHHVGGQLKVAPEHASPAVLRAMNKPSFDKYEIFVEKFREIKRRVKKDQYLVNYFISAHPGATLEDEEILSSYLRRRGMHPEQVQDFTPLPLTPAACMYYTEENPFTGEKVFVAKTFQERKLHRALIQHHTPSHKPLVAKAMQSLSKKDRLKPAR